MGSKKDSLATVVEHGRKSDSAVINYRLEKYAYGSGQLMSAKEHLDWQPRMSSTGHSTSNVALGKKQEASNSNFVMPTRGFRNRVRKMKVDPSDSSNSFASRTHHYPPSSDSAIRATDRMNKPNVHNLVRREDIESCRWMLIPSLADYGKPDLPSRNNYCKTRSCSQPSKSNINSNLRENHHFRGGSEAPDNMVRGPKAIKSNGCKSSSTDQSSNSNISSRVGKNHNFHNSYEGSDNLVLHPRANRTNSFLNSSGENSHLNGNVRRDINNNEGSDNVVRGPRSIRTNSCLNSSGENRHLNGIVRRDNYNKPDFEIKYEHAKFFMIKSFNEEDIHKSIKYNVWASTPNGNLKLNSAYQEVEKIKNEKGIKCPIFLFFSVNTSGQFVGLAEMIGPFDFNKSMDFWQEKIWNGFFPVAWHILKDIPNRLFQSITLENNGNRTVTFSRDTQEIGLPQGSRMLDIFKSYQHRSSMLDDFEFYEKREKSLLATKLRSADRDSDDFDDYDYLEYEYGEQDYGGTSMKHLESAVSNMTVSANLINPSRTLADAARSYSKT